MPRNRLLSNSNILFLNNESNCFMGAYFTIVINYTNILYTFVYVYFAIKTDFLKTSRRKIR